MKKLKTGIRTYQKGNSIEVMTEQEYLMAQAEKDYRRGVRNINLKAIAFIIFSVIYLLLTTSCSSDSIEEEDCGCVGTTLYYEEGVGFIAIERNQPLEGCPEEVEYQELEEGSGIYWIIDCDFI